MPASKTALMCLSQPEFSRPSRKSDMEGERSSHTATTTQLSHWQETWSIPDHWSTQQQLSMNFSVAWKNEGHTALLFFIRHFLQFLIWCFIQTLVLVFWQVSTTALRVTMLVWPSAYHFGPQTLNVSDFLLVPSTGQHMHWWKILCNSISVYELPFNASMLNIT